MRKKSIVKQKAEVFASKVVGVYRMLKENKEYALANQILKSGTSIGANVNEALAGESERDFLHKMSIASKEARETYYWMKLLHKNQIVSYNFDKELKSCQELIRMLTAIVKTTKTKLQGKRLKTND